MVEIQAIIQAVIKAIKGSSQDRIAEVVDAMVGNAGRVIMGGAGTKRGEPSLEQPKFSCTAKAKYMDLKNFQMEINYIFSTKIIT